MNNKRARHFRGRAAPVSSRTLEVAITDMEGEPKSDASTIEEQCAGVVEQRFDEAVEFSALTRNPYNRRL
jgi:hypothetical protein